VSSPKKLQKIFSLFPLVLLFLFISSSLFISPHLSLSLSRAFKEDKDGSEDFERKRRRREEERV
jgi:hypothetical protein